MRITPIPDIVIQQPSGFLEIDIEVPKQTQQSFLETPIIHFQNIECLFRGFDFADPLMYPQPLFFLTSLKINVRLLLNESALPLSDVLKGRDLPHQKLNLRVR